MTTLSRAIARDMLARAASGIPPAVAEQGWLHARDMIGIALAAHRLPVARQAIDAMSAGTGPCPVIGVPLRLPPAQAAFLNSALAHALDFDDVHDAARLHPTSVTLPAALAAAALHGVGTGTAITGAILGNELMCRLGVALAPAGQGPGADWFLTQLFGYAGAAVAAAVVLGLDEATVESALGLAYMQMAGGKEAGFGTGGTARSIYPAFAAMGGVQAALLAQSGILGPATAFDGAAGLYRAYLGTEPPAPAQLLGPGWVWTGTAIKPWPSCRLSHPYVAAALDLRARLDGRPVERVSIEVNPSAAKLCRPLAERVKPATLQDAKYSIPFMVAFALAHGEPTIASLDEAAVRDPDVLALAARIGLAETLPDKPGMPDATVTVATAAGPLHSRPRPEIPVTPDQVRRKFFDCAGYGGFAAVAEGIWAGRLELAYGPGRC